MTTAINIKETIVDDSSNFNIKIFKLGDVLINRPIKSLKVDSITYKTYNKFIKSRKLESYITFYEISRTFKEDTIYKIINESDNKSVSNMFRYKQWPKPLLLTYTLNFNPFKPNIIDDLGDLEGFLSYYYAMSDVALFVPNIKVKKSIKVSDKKYKTIKIMNFNEYLEYVDWSVQQLSSRNNKPIFVPVSLKFSIKELALLAKHYVKKEYFNIWIDFESGTPSPQNIGKIRHFLNVFWSEGRFNDIVIYVTNIKREFHSHPDKLFTPGTDPIVSLIGANLIGVNKSKVVPDNKLNKKEILGLKARLFDPNTYYYLHPDLIKDKELREIIEDNEKNILLNTLRINFELNRQTEFFLDKLEIKTYVNKKRMLLEYKGGELLNLLFSGRTTKLTGYISGKDKMQETLDIDLLSLLPENNNED